MSLVTADRRHLPKLTAADLIKAAKLDPPEDRIQAEMEREMFKDEPQVLEIARTNSLRVPLNILQMHLESEQDVILSELAAKYLPKLLETYKKRDYPFNTAATLMNMVTHTPYFIRFCQQPEGEKLAALHTHRLATQGFHRDHLNEDNVGETCQFLSSLLVTIGSTTVDQKDKEALLPTLKEWRKRYRGEFAKETIGRCIDQLSHKGASGLGMMFLEPMMKAQLEKGVEICKSAKCSVSAKSIGHELMQCSRCKCVRYCCIEHQRADWPEHKRLCFQPNF